MPSTTITYPFLQDVRLINRMAKEGQYAGMFDEIIPFQTRPTVDTVVSIAANESGLTILSDKPRGGDNDNLRQGDEGRVVSFRIPHFPIEGTISAQSYQSMIDPATGRALNPLAQKVNEKMRQDIVSHRVRINYMKSQLFKGLITNELGTTLLDLYTNFGYQRATPTAIDLTNDAEDISGLMRTIFENMLTAGSAVTMTEKPLMLVSSAAYNAINQIVQAQSKADDYFRDIGLNRIITKFDVDIMAVYGTYNGNLFVEADKGYVIPRGIPEFYYQYNAPPVLNSNTGLNVVAPQEMYALRVPNKKNSGVTLYTESDPLVIVTDPRLLLEVDFTLPT